MIKEEKKLSGPDLSKGVPFAEVPPEGMLLGHVANEEVLGAVRWRNFRRLSALHSLSGSPCRGTCCRHHITMPLASRPLDLCTGEAVGAPAIDAIGCWEIEQRDGLISVVSKRKRQKSKQNDQNCRGTSKDRHRRRRRCGICGG